MVLHLWVTKQKCVDVARCLYDITQRHGFNWQKCVYGQLEAEWFNQQMGGMYSQDWG